MISSTRVIVETQVSLHKTHPTPSPPTPVDTSPVVPDFTKTATPQIKDHAVTGNSKAGVITFNTVAAGTFNLHVAYATPLSAAPNAVVVYGSNAASTNRGFYVASSDVSGFTVKSSNPLGSNLDYSLTFAVL